MNNFNVLTKVIVNNNTFFKPLEDKYTYVDSLKYHCSSLKDLILQIQPTAFLISDTFDLSNFQATTYDDDFITELCYKLNSKGFNRHKNNEKDYHQATTVDEAIDCITLKYLSYDSKQATEVIKNSLTGILKPTTYSDVHMHASNFALAQDANTQLTINAQNIKLMKACTYSLPDAERDTYFSLIDTEQDAAVKRHSWITYISSPVGKIEQECYGIKGRLDAITNLVHQALTGDIDESSFNTLTANIDAIKLVLGDYLTKKVESIITDTVDSEAMPTAKTVQSDELYTDEIQLNDLFNQLEANLKTLEKD